MEKMAPGGIVYHTLKERQRTFGLSREAQSTLQQAWKPCGSVQLMGYPSVCKILSYSMITDDLWWGGEGRARSWSLWLNI